MDIITLIEATIKANPYAIFFQMKYVNKINVLQNDLRRYSFY